MDGDKSPISGASVMAKVAKRRTRHLALWIPVLFAGVLAWYTYGRVRQERLDRALIAAVQQGAAVHVRSLLDEGADANAQRRETEETGFLHVLRRMFPHNRSVTESTASALSLAVERGDVATAQALLDHGADPNGRDSQGQPLLVTALAAMNIPNAAIVRALLAAGADPNARDTRGRPALFYVIQDYGGDSQLLNAFLARGADLNVRNDAGNTPLTWAALQGDAVLAQRLLDGGADVNATNRDGATALRLAQALDHAEVVDMLLKAGAKEEGGKR